MDATMQELQHKIEHLYACHVQSMDVIAQQVHEYFALLVQKYKY